jgi:trehalose 6-phosphate phosphatase
VAYCKRQEFALLSSRFDAVIFDLDGVITDTVRVHAAAWKEMFDTFLKEYAEQHSGFYQPFDKGEDYRRYVDGKPRYDGVADFLSARNIKLARGDPDDPPGKATVCALENRENRLFQKKIEQGGVTVYDSTICLIHQLRSKRVKIAVVSSSKNCRKILEAAGIANLFDVKIDGQDAAEQNLDGKPAPDIFLKAARQLGVRPERAAVVEDALAGVEAAKLGGFACVIGVDRTDQAAALADRGADLVVGDLCEIRIDQQLVPRKIAEKLPSALERRDEIAARFCGCIIAVFLDYDGTLTPIVRRPEEAELSETMRRVIRKLAKHCAVSIVSGRDLPDVRDLIGIEGLYYAGSHGFDIAGPGDRRHEHPAGARWLPQIDEAEEQLKNRLNRVRGCRVERKKFAVAVHYREVADEHAVKAIHEASSGLRLSGGKKVFELQPDVDWNKGRAVRWLMEDALDLNRGNVMPIYIGDDVTDEDAFRELRNDGIGVLVDDTDQRDSAARYRLRNPHEVQHFLRWLADRLQQEEDLRD